MTLLLNSLLLLPVLLVIRFFFPSINFPPTQSLVSASSSALLTGASSQKQTWKDLRNKLADADLAQLVSTSPEDHRLFNETLSKIMVPRVADTPSHAKVRTFIGDYLRNLEWNVEENQFKDRTPFGQKTFTNIIATLNPNACKRVVLSCHYDSKYFPNFEFLGATDSAVPCTMILELVRILDKQLKRHKNNNNISLQLMFFDGEEAFKDWSATDSLYGSRHLASRLESQQFRAEQCSELTEYRNIRNEIDRIEVLILLDLIGEASPQFCNHYSETKPLFERLVKIEKKLNELKLVESKRRSGTRYFALNCLSGWRVEDDHIPFFENGVPPLHIIATPFPQEWHRQGDDGDHLHHPTINNLMKIFRVFLLEYLNLDK